MSFLKLMRMGFRKLYPSLYLQAGVWERAVKAEYPEPAHFGKRKAQSMLMKR
jgi:hypothetical protein